MSEPLPPTAAPGSLAATAVTPCKLPPCDPLQAASASNAAVMDMAAAALALDLRLHSQVGCSG